MQRLYVAFTLIALLISSNAHALKEKETGVVFPKGKKMGSHQLEIVGTAVREKFFVDVYAAGFYLAQDASESFKQSEGSKIKNLYKDGKINKRALLRAKGLYKWLVSANVAMKIDMHFVRNVEKEKIKKQFSESIALNIGKMSPSKKKAIDQLVSSISDDMKKNGHLVINFYPNGKVGLEVMGKNKAPIVNAALSKALKAMYFGRKPIDKGIKKGLVSHIDRVLK